eukprot:TCONS_00049717-protein
MNNVRKTQEKWLAIYLLAISSLYLPVSTVKALYQCSRYYDKSCKVYDRRMATKARIYSMGYHTTEYYNIEIASSFHNMDRMLRLKWESFRLSGDMPDCSKDKVVVFTGCYDQEIVGTFCGNENKPHDIYTHSKCVTLKFVNGDKYRSRFVVMAEYIDLVSIPHSGCTWYDRVLTEPSGVIFSPGWPHGTGKNRVECNWRIRTQSDKIITLNIMDDDFKSHTYSCQSYLKLDGKLSNPYYLFYKKICDNRYYNGDRPSNTYNTYNSDVKVEYVFKKVFNNKNYRGLVLGWTTYDNPKQHTRQTVAPTVTNNHKNSANNRKPQFTTTGVVTSSIFAIVVLSVMIMCARARHRRATLLARQHANQSVVANQLNRERTLAASSSTNGVARASNQESGNGNLSDIEKINTTPYYLPPPRYTATDSTGPPPSYNDIFSSVPSSEQQAPNQYPAQPYTNQMPPQQGPNRSAYNLPPVYNGIQPITIPLQTTSAASQQHPDTHSGTAGSVRVVAPYPQAVPPQQASIDNPPA